MAVIGRIEDGDSRYYVDPANSDVVLNSVTAVLSATNAKRYLQDWTAKLAAEFSVDQHEVVTNVRQSVGRDAAVDLIKGEAKRLRELKADIGSHQHDVLEALLLDRPIPELPLHLDGVEVDGDRVDHDAISDGLLNFLNDFDVKAEMAEATVANPELGYAGTLDLVAHFPTLRSPSNPKKLGARGLVDCKAGKNLDDTMRPQLASYRYATEVWVDHLGNKERMPECDFAAILHLRRDYARGYKLLHVETPPASFARFIHSLEAYRLAKAEPKIRGRALYKPLPDGTQPPPLLEDIESEGFARCRGALIKAGLSSLADLAALTEAECKAIKGVGPAAMTAIGQLFTEHRLTFQKGA